MKTKFHVQVEMKIIRQFEVFCDDEASDSEIENIAIDKAKEEYGQYEEFKAVSIDYASLGADMSKEKWEDMSWAYSRDSRLSGADLNLSGDDL